MNFLNKQTCENYVVIGYNSDIIRLDKEAKICTYYALSKIYFRLLRRISNVQYRVNLHKNGF